MCFDSGLVLFLLAVGTRFYPCFAVTGGAAPNLYPPIHGLDHFGPAVDASPDPLVRYRWLASVNQSVLQQFNLYPKTVSVVPVSSFENVQSLMNGSNTNVTVTGVGSIMMDFGQENAAWLEFDSPDLNPSKSEVLMSISEYNLPAVVNVGGPLHYNKTATPIAYHGHWFVTYRLELNALLYEGVRFGWLHVETHDGTPWHITGLRLVCQTKPQGYVGSFSSSNDELTRIWWTAAYTVRLNLMGSYMGSILMDRGDRFSWTGDAHTIQATSMVAFHNFPFVLDNINRTSCATCSNGIPCYALYWVLSVCDYYWSGAQDAATALLHFAPQAREQEETNIIGRWPGWGWGRGS